jgi:hypothetical protein
MGGTFPPVLSTRIKRFPARRKQPPFGTDPNRSLMVLVNGSNEVVTQPGAGTVTQKFAGRITQHATALGSYPQRAIFGRQKSRDSVLAEPLCVFAAVQ